MRPKFKDLMNCKFTPEVDLENEIKRYTEEKYKETFGNGQGTLDEFDWEDIAVTIEETAVHFVGWKEKAPEYKTISKILALGFMNCLDDNRQKGKMCLSNVECEDITKAVSEQDWKKLERYAKKYTVTSRSGSAEHLRNSTKMIPEELEKAARHVYESWMGGTMDDVRRDMVELGRVINARK